MPTKHPQPPAPQAARPTTPAISVKNVTLSYGQNVVLRDISFDVAQGEVAALIGPNGSGKTSLMKAILGLQPVKGTISVFGKHLHTVRDMIGYVPQRLDFDRDFPITVGEFMDLARHAHCPKSHIAAKIKEVGLPARVIDQRLGSLSGGQLQRVLIAQAILNEPALLFLDEAAAGIDIAGEATLTELIEHLNKEHGTTILMVSHDIGMVSELVHNVICVNKKLLCYGPPKSALTLRKMHEMFGPSDGFYEHGHPGGHTHAPGETHDHGH